MISSYELHGGVQLYAYYGASIFLILSLGIVGNTLAIVVLLQPEHRTKSMTGLMINLCVADLLVCLLGYIVAFNYNTVDFANTGETPVVCIWLAIINCLTGLASIGTLTVMGIMSYQGIVRNEVAHENRMSRKVEAGVILGTWIYALVLSVPPALGWNRFVAIPSRISCHPDWYSPNTVDKSYIIYLLMFGFFLPSAIIFCSYLGIYRYIRGSSVIRVSNDVLLERQLKTRKKTVRIVMAMTVAFFISWSPYALSSLIGSIMGRQSVSPAYSMIPELMAKASVVYNPILYAFLNSRFRITLLNLCNCSTNRVGNASTESSDLSFPDSATGGVEMRRRGVPVHQ
ncbi:Pinopsin [Acropora cervicornis]|uniref:Pinopsin n=1 Tax=Acropora cervicornis TaxID=6130 RepID=A0AAD9V5S5_ACRCE|nr:Pinopsin [Acropora cervicornis]